MRLLKLFCLALVLLNLLLLIVAASQHAPRLPHAANKILPRVATLVLWESPLTRTETSAGPAEEMPLPFDEKSDGEVSSAACLQVGAFEDAATASMFLEQYRTYVLDWKLSKALSAPSSFYQVVTRPSGSREASRLTLRFLQRKSIDSFLMEQGPYANSISLGLFKHLTSARQQLATMAALGVDAQIVLFSAQSSATSLDIRTSNIQALLETIQKDEVSSKAIKQWILVDCETVALPSKTP